MDAVTVTLPSATHADTDFPALFRTYLLNGVRQAVQQVRTDPNLVRDEPVREHVLHMLTFALDAPDAYPMAWEIVQRITPAMEQAGLWELWIHYLHKTMAQCHLRQDRSVAAFCTFWLGQIYQNQSDFAAAREQWHGAAQRFAEMGDPLNQAKSLNRLAYLARLQRQFDDSERFVSHALTLLPIDDPERSFSYFVQGACALDKEHWQAAVNHLQASLAISEQHGDQVIIARRLRNLGPALRILGRYDEAIACYERAIDLFAEVYDPVQQAVTWMNLGVVYLQIDQPQQALHCFDKAEPAFRTAHDQWHRAMLHLDQAIAYRMVKDWTKAKTFCETAITLFQQVGNVEGEVNALEDLGLIYMGQGCLAQARRTFQSGFGLLNQMAGDPAHATLARSFSAHLQKVSSAAKRCRQPIAR